MEFPSKLIEDAVNEVAKLPGIGKKTALRLVLHLIKENENLPYLEGLLMIGLKNSYTFAVNRIL